MEKENVKEYEGKRVLLILKNNYKYTCIIPSFEGNSFFIDDVFGERVLVDCDFIDFIREVKK